LATGSSQLFSDISLNFKPEALTIVRSSGIQILPAILPQVKSVTTFIREPTWYVEVVGAEISEIDIARVSPVQGLEQKIYTAAEKEEFRRNPSSLLQYRQKIERGNNRLFPLFLQGSDENKATTTHMVDAMKGKLNDQKLENLLIPSWSVGCRRVSSFHNAGFSRCELTTY
jgi:hypothetical protein